jgi:hypothetical protein
MSATSCTGHGKNEHSFLPSFPLHAIPDSHQLPHLFFQWPLLFGVEGGEMYVVGTGCHTYIFITRVHSFADSSNCLVAKRVKHWSTELLIQRGKGKGKAIPLQAWTGREGSRRLRLPDFKTIGT